jgi:hypothetical protein
MSVIVIEGLKFVATTAATGFIAGSSMLLGLWGTRKLVQKITGEDPLATVVSSDFSLTREASEVMQKTGESMRDCAKSVKLAIDSLRGKAAADGKPDIGPDADAA